AGDGCQVAGDRQAPGTIRTAHQPTIMIPGSLWLTKLLLAHLLTDFVLQPRSWVEERYRQHFTSVKLYLHAVLTACLAWLFIGWQYWLVALIILVTHFLIDAWKSWRPRTTRYFIADQLLHLLVLAGCWMLTFRVTDLWDRIGHWVNADGHHWIVVTAFVFVTTPAGVLIGQLTDQWSRRIADPDNSLVNAGKWIGVAERVIVLILVLQNQYSAIGLLITAKGIIRFSEKDRQEIKTEYLVIGTLLSIGIAILAGIVVKLLA
ncbi:MAG TPA: DUF3307 domain-containing protein, partial [Puia sp.]|nr:DUF3307 domain-containing protein [Puia sp.]